MYTLLHSTNVPSSHDLPDHLRLNVGEHDMVEKELRRSLDRNQVFSQDRRTVLSYSSQQHDFGNFQLFTDFHALLYT